MISDALSLIQYRSFTHACLWRRPAPTRRQPGCRRPQGATSSILQAIKTRTGTAGITGRACPVRLESCGPTAERLAISSGGACGESPGGTAALWSATWRPGWRGSRVGWPRPFKLAGEFDDFCLGFAAASREAHLVAGTGGGRCLVGRGRLHPLEADLVDGEQYADDEEAEP